jgi:hypothetical protein
MLARGIEAVVHELVGSVPRRSPTWARLTWDVSARPGALVLVGIDEDFDRDRAHALSAECPEAYVIACGVHVAELTVMCGGEVLVSGPLSAESLRSAIEGARGAGLASRAPTS